MIPLELLGQLDGTDWTLEKFVQYQEAFKNNPNNLLFLLVNVMKDRQEVIGFLWGSVDEIKEAIIIHALSVKPEYQNGTIIPFTRKFMEMIIRKTEQRIKNVYWYTTADKGYERHGLHRSKWQLMCLYPD